MDNTSELTSPLQQPSLNPGETLGNPPSDLQLRLAARHFCHRMKNPCESQRGKVNVILKLEISILSNEMPCCLISFNGVRLYIKASWVLNYMSDTILHCGHEMWDCPLREEKSSSAQSGWQWAHLHNHSKSGDWSQPWMRGWKVAMDTDSRVQCWLRYLHLPWKHPWFVADSASRTQKAGHQCTSFRVPWQQLLWAHFREEPQCLYKKGFLSFSCR